MRILDSIDYRHNGSVNRFRRKRGALLRGQMARLAGRLGRPLTVLDVGGRPDYWENVGLEHVAHVTLLNARQQELDRPLPAGLPEGVFSKSLGDARDLVGYADQSVDLVHANSVIEHVGSWEDMARMASDGRAGCRRRRGAFRSSRISTPRSCTGSGRRCARGCCRCRSGGRSGTWTSPPAGGRSRGSTS